MKKYSAEDMLAYFYRECPQEISASIHNRLSTDWALAEKLAVMKEAIDRLGKMPLLSPPNQLVIDICSGVHDFKSAVLPEG